MRSHHCVLTKESHRRGIQMDSNMHSEPTRSCKGNAQGRKKHIHRALKTQSAASVGTNGLQNAGAKIWGWVWVDKVGVNA